MDLFLKAIDFKLSLLLYLDFYVPSHGMSSLESTCLLSLYLLGRKMSTFMVYFSSTKSGI
jgi:hypothetical protein